MIKIGRTINGIPPSVPLKLSNERNYRKIDCIDIYSGLNLIKRAEFSSLHPDRLRAVSGKFLSNIWKFSKVHHYVPRIKLIAPSGKLIIDAWNHPSEFHVIDGTITKEFWEWRRKGFDLKYSISSPVGSLSKENYIGFVPVHCHLTGNVPVENVEILDLIKARKSIYYELYSRQIKKESQFNELKGWLKNGQNLFIIDPDGPYFEDLKYYKDKYSVDDEFITSTNITMATEENLKIFLNDELHEAGFSYYLAALLLDLEVF